MNLLKRIAILLLIAASATFIGYRLRLARHERALLHAEVQSELARQYTKSPRKLAPKELPPSPLVQKLENDIAMSKGVTRWLDWLEAIEKAQATDFPRLLALAENSPELTKLVATRWAEKFPNSFFDYAVARSKNGERTPWEALDILFTTWAKNDPNALIAALNTAGDYGGRTDWRMQAVNMLFKNDVETGLRLMSQWHIENYTPDLKGVEKWAATDPLHAAQYALKYPAGHASRSIVQIIGREWAKTDPTAALAFSAGGGDAYKSTLSRAALSQWVEQDLKKASEWLVAAPASARNELSPDFIHTWAKSDLPGALEWSQANLTGSVLARSVGNAIKAFADKDASIAANYVADMPPSTARGEAAAAVAEKWFPDSFSEKAPPKEAIDWISKLDPESARRAITQVHWKWEDTDPKGMAAFLEQTQNDQLPTYLYQNLARNLARKDPQDALDWTARLPEKVRDDSMEFAFREWRQAQPEAAADWLTKLPDDTRRARLFDNTLREWATDPLKTDQLARFAALNEKAAEKIFNDLQLPDARRAALLAILPSRKTAQK